MNDAQCLVTVVVPVYNDKSHLERAIVSIGTRPDVEVIVIDSGSNDGTESVARSLCGALSFTFVRLDENHGPGVARNAGLALASGRYVVFLDSDDELIPGWLELIEAGLASADIVAFNWVPDSLERENQVPRRDMHFIKDRCGRRRRFLRHQMDGSVIFTAFRRDFLTSNNLVFRPGVHEDVDFLFKAYCLADEVETIDEVVYRKHSRAGSVTSAMSQLRLRDYLDAWHRIWEWNSSEPCRDCGSTHVEDCEIGAAGVTVSIAREVVRRVQSVDEAMSQIASVWAIAKKGPYFREAMEASDEWWKSSYGQLWTVLVKCAVAGQFREFMDKALEIEGKSWSCVDLEGSLFLTPNEARTCCKRFYVNGERRGDVALPLANIAKDAALQVRSLEIARAELRFDINAGESTACSGCPFLQFQSWPSHVGFPVRYLSMEHHSVCNLRCSYCDDEYYGGKRPNFDVAETVKGLASSGSLRTCHTVVWGGGEPTLDPKFAEMTDMVRDAAPNATQRVLTNSVRFSPALHGLLRGGFAELVTSVDAGTAPIFRIVRGRRGLRPQLENIRKYLEASPERVTVKYILTPENSHSEELEAFVEAVQEFDLSSAVFQISSDFKDEFVDESRASAAAHLFGLLYQSGARMAFFDDLLQLRLNWSANQVSGESWFTSAGSAAADECDWGKFKLWGAGEIAHTLLRREGFRDRWGIEEVYDHRPERIGSAICGLPVRLPPAEDVDCTQFLPLAAQGMAALLSDLGGFGVPKQNIFRKLVW